MSSDVPLKNFAVQSHNGKKLHWKEILNCPICATFLLFGFWLPNLYDYAVSLNTLVKQDDKYIIFLGEESNEQNINEKIDTVDGISF